MKESVADQEIDSKNRTFWDEPCGSTVYQNMGFASPAEFYDWFFKYYPYLEKIIPFDDLGGKRVLEVGLGYGSVSQKLIENGASFFGLDIAEGPVGLVKDRLGALEVEGEVIEGSVLEIVHGKTRLLILWSLLVASITLAIQSRGSRKCIESSSLEVVVLLWSTMLFLIGSGSPLLRLPFLNSTKK